MISETSSTKLDKKKKKLDTLCFLWLSTHGTTPISSHLFLEFSSIKSKINRQKHASDNLISYDVSR